MNSPAEQWQLFAPPRRKGVVINLGGLLLTTTLVVVLLSLSVSQQPGLPVILLLLGALLFSLPIPVLIYRLYCLLQSGYWLGRNGMRLRWGLRWVQLPFDYVVDIARADELENPLNLPRWTWPGSVVGQTNDGELGRIEFLSSEAEQLVLLGTRDGVIAISPENAQTFVAEFKRQSERGSLRPVTPYSISPSFVLVEAWAEAWVAALLVSGAALALGLLVLVAILVPGLGAVSLGSVDSQSAEQVAGVQLFLLPALNLFFYMGNFILGLLFYREQQGLRFSYLLWGSSVVTGVLFLLGVLANL